MKKIILTFLIISTSIFAQSTPIKDIVHLRSRIKIHDSDIIQFQQSPMEKKNNGLAILYSLLLPGMGELYAGNYSNGKYFTITEGVLWGTYAGIKIYADNQRDNYLAFANSFGGVSSEGKDDLFYATIGDYIDIDQYNTIQELNRQFDNIYDEQTHYWNWKDNTTRKEYRNMWISSEQANNNLRFVIGAMIVNRIISAINAARLVSAYNNNLKDQVSWNISVGVTNINSTPAGMKLNFQTAF